MKYIRLIALLLVLPMLLGAFAACNPAADTPTETTPTPETTPAPDVPDKKQLIVYADGEYKTKLIERDGAKDEEKENMLSMLAMFETVIGKKPEALTDTAPESMSMPAILVGDTNVAESITTNATLGENEACAQFVNNKYVIAYKSSKGCFMLMQKIEEKLRACIAKNPNSIAIDESWNIKLSASEVLGYAADKLVEQLELPLYNGKAFDQTDIDLGQSSLMYIASKTNADEYAQFLKDLETKGFVFYTDNQIGNNKYATYITKTQIVNVMHFAAKSETRVTVDTRSVYDLAGLESDNIYKKTVDPSLTVIGIGTSGYPGGMGYVYKLSDGRFFIIDGGITKDEECPNKSNCSAEWLYYTLRELADDPDNIVVAGWLLTHIHNDHVGAFIDMANNKKYTNDITVETVIYSQPNDAHFVHIGKGYRRAWIPKAINRWKPDTVVKAHPGQVFYFADLKLNILGSQDLVLPGTIDSHNNMSIISMVEFKGYDALYLADAEGLMNKQLKTIYAKDLKCDILQLAHHGYHNTDAGIVYDYTDPRIVFWPVSTGHYDGSGGATVRDVTFNQRFFADGIVNHIAGETNMTIKNFETWSPEPRWNPMPKS